MISNLPEKLNGLLLAGGQVGATAGGARVCDPRRVICKTSAGNTFHATFPSARCGSQSRAPEFAQCIPCLLNLHEKIHAKFSSRSVNFGFLESKAVCLCMKANSPE